MITNLATSIPVDFGDSSYAIKIGRNILNNLGTILRQKTQNKKIMIVGDRYLQPFIEDKICAILENEGFVVFFYYFDGGKQNKNINQVMKIYGVLEENEFSRDSVLVAIGGGVIGDLAGFVAST